MKKIVCVLCVLSVLTMCLFVPASAAEAKREVTYYGDVYVPMHNSSVYLSFTAFTTFDDFVLVYNVVNMSFDLYVWENTPLGLVNWYVSAVSDQEGLFELKLNRLFDDSLVVYKSSVPYDLTQAGSSVDLEFSDFTVADSSISSYIIGAASDRYGGYGSSPAFSYLQRQSAIVGVMNNSTQFVRGLIGMLGASAEAFLNHSVLMLFIFAIPLSTVAVVLVRGLIKKRKR